MYYIYHIFIIYIYDSHIYIYIYMLLAFQQTLIMVVFLAAGWGTCISEGRITRE